LNHYQQDGDPPTFSEFVEFILRENEEGKVLDEHWMPVYRFCNPCQVFFLLSNTASDQFDSNQFYQILIDF
jgi:hypothetical protein